MSRIGDSITVNGASLGLVLFSLLVEKNHNGATDPGVANGANKAVAVYQSTDFWLGRARMNAGALLARAAVHRMTMTTVICSCSLRSFVCWSRRTLALVVLSVIGAGLASRRRRL